MADPQQFIIRKPGGKPLMTVNDVTAALFTASNLPSGTGIAVVEITEQTTLVPWRIIYRSTSTVAAFDHYPTEDEVHAALTTQRTFAGHEGAELSDLAIKYDLTTI